MPNEEFLFVKVYDGKYEFRLPANDWRVHVLRYGEAWLVIEEGHNAISSLVRLAADQGDQILQLEEENTELRLAINKLKENER